MVLDFPLRKSPSSIWSSPAESRDISHTVSMRAERTRKTTTVFYFEEQLTQNIMSSSFGLSQPTMTQMIKATLLHNKNKYKIYTCFLNKEITFTHLQLISFKCKWDSKQLMLFSPLTDKVNLDVLTTAPASWWSWTRSKETSPSQPAPPVGQYWWRS